MELSEVLLFKVFIKTTGQIKQQRGNKGEEDKKSGGDQQSHMTSDV
jgi:hypothetical protein